MRIFVASSSEGSFVKRDLEILRTQHEVSFHSSRRVSLFRFLAALPQLLGSQLVFFWFASLRNLPYLLAAVFFGKKIVTVVGGYEAANRPDLHYGSARGGLRTSLTRLILGASSVVLSVSEFSQREVATNLGISESKCRMLYHGFEDVAAGKRADKRKQVISVTAITPSTWLLKGIKDFVAVAERLPGTKFCLIGGQGAVPEQLWGGALPHNVELVGQVPYTEIGNHLSAAKVYLQLSRAESFGCAVAEAMICRAIPVVSDVGALPEVVGETGLLVPVDDLDAAVAAVRQALAATAEQGDAARARILSEFSYEKRSEALLELVAAFEPSRKRRQFSR